jgi:hypothetical protein
MENEERITFLVSFYLLGSRKRRKKAVTEPLSLGGKNRLSKYEPRQTD